MQLCDKDILKLLKNGDLEIKGTKEYPFSIYQQVQPASVDLRLGSQFFRFKNDVKCIDIKDIESTESIKKLMSEEDYPEGTKIIINPHEIVYGQIHEQLAISDSFSARIVGRSRVARLGLSIHCTGSYINPGFCGAMPLQICNHNNFPIIIYPYITICQLVLYRITDIPLITYSKRATLQSNPYYNETKAGPSILSIYEEDSETVVMRQITNSMDRFMQALDDKNNFGND